MAAKSELHREYILELENELRELESREAASTKRMQLIVYPAMVAFVILAAYGFYLIQSLTNDVHKMVDSVTRMTLAIEPMAKAVTVDMDTMASVIESLNGEMKNVSTSVSSVSGDMSFMRNAVLSMAGSTHNIQQDMSSLNHNVSKPLSLFNRFIPWRNNRSRSANYTTNYPHYNASGYATYWPYPQYQQPFVNQPQVNPSPQKALSITSTTTTTQP